MKTKTPFIKALSLILSILMIISVSPIVFAVSEYDELGATKLVFSNDKITATVGNYKGYKIEGTNLSIKDSGTYILSGECEDGSVVVKKGVKDVVIILDGLTLTSKSTAPLTCNKSTKVTIFAKENSINTFTDTALNNDDSYPENENAENAVFKFKDGSQITLKGKGTVNIISNGKNGIKTGETTDAEGEAQFSIEEITLNITVSVNDGINCESTLNIKSGNINVSAADDGIHSDYVLNIGEENTAGPVIRINKSYEGLEGANINVYSGDIEVHSSDDGINAANSDLKNYNFSMTFSGGKTVVYADGGDGVDSNGTLTISGGTLIVWTSNKADNQPLDADGAISITSGTVFAAGSSGGMGTKISASQPFIKLGQDRMNFGLHFGNSSNNINISSGETVCVKDKDGNILFTAKAPYDIKSIVFSSSDMTQGEKYTVFANDKEIASQNSQSAASANCSCLCHKDGIINIVWQIAIRFMRIFNINKTCKCGVIHY